jgi:broad specificity phosphatase PhoE
MGSLLLVRHGQASFGAADYDKLSKIGEEQSQQLGLWLKRVGQLPDLIAVGPLRRHTRTADLCMEAAGMNAPRIDVAGLDEIDHVEILARSRPELASPEAMKAELALSAQPNRAFQKMYVDAVTRWTSGNFDKEYTRTWPTFRRTVLETLQMLARHDAPTIWAFTSGGPIAVIVNALINAPLDEAFELSWPLVNTSLTRVSTSPQRNRLISFNAWPHLDNASDTRLITHR